MSWSDQDNKNIRGPKDSIYVSLTEPWEVNYFIDHYLQSRYTVTDKNREIVRESIKQYSGRSPVLRSTLEAYLDRLYKK